MKSLYLTRPVHKRFIISSPFGPRIHPVTKVEKMHNGYDFACSLGTPVSAMHDGRIIVVGYEDPHDHNKGYGLRVYEEIHTVDAAYLLVYAHLSNVSVYEGQHISEHGLIGHSGNSGLSSGPHLHVGGRIKDSSEWVSIKWEGEEDFCDKSIIKMADIPGEKEKENNVA